MPIVEKVKKNSDVYDIQDSRISDISSLATLTGVQTLSNKTLINPVIQSGSGANDKITVEGKIQSTNPVKLESELISFKPISIQYSAQGTESGADGRAKWTVYPTSSNSGMVASRLSLMVSNDGASPVVEIGRSSGPSSEVQKLVLSTNTTPGSTAAPVLEKYNGQNRIFQWTLPAANGTLALNSEVTSLASTVDSNYSNTVKKNDSGLQYITGGLSVASGIISPNYMSTSVVSGTTYPHSISAGVEHIDYGEIYYKPYLRFTTAGTFARNVVNPQISLGTHISDYHVYGFIRGLSPNQNSGEADYVEYKLPQVDSNEITETTLLCAHDLQDRFYAPTTPGTTSQVLMGNPSGEPQWKNLSDVAGKGFTLHVFLEDSTGGNVEGSVSLSIYYANGSWDFVTLTIPEGGHTSRIFYHVSGYTLSQRSIRGMYDRLDGDCGGNRAKLSESTNQFGGAVSGDLITSAAGTSYLMLSDVSYTVHFEN